MRIPILLSSIIAMTLCSVLVAAPPTEGDAPTETGLANLESFARMTGLVRYYSPTDEAAGNDWDEWVTRNVHVAERATTDDLVDALHVMFAPVAPAIQIWRGGEDDAPDPIDLIPDDGTVDGWTAWHHQGRGGDANDAATRQSIYRSERRRFPSDRISGDIPPPGAAVVRSIGDDLWCRLPICLPYVGDAILHSAPPPPPADPIFDATRSRRLAAVIKIWNVFQHFYPYFDVVDVDWSAHLGPALSDAANCTSDLECLGVMRRLVAALRDGHGMVMHVSDQRMYALPFTTTWVGDELVIAQVHDIMAARDDAPRPGDVIVSIDRRSVSELYAEAAPQISAATEQFRRYRALTDLARSDHDRPAMLELRRFDGEGVALPAPRITVQQWFSMQPNRPENGAELAPGVVYFDVNQASMEDLGGVMDTLTEAKGIVFDLRGYPGDAGKTILHHLTDDVIYSPEWNIPVFLYPDQENVTWRKSRWTMTPMQPRFTDHVAFVTDGRAISYAESCLGAVEGHELAAIVGGPTAGTNGNVNPFTAPGGYRISWTGMKVLKHDGTPHHGVGVLPTVPADRTIQGIAAGRDELLERAVEVVLEMIR